MRDTSAMRGYGNSSYGDGFADVYDDWYETVTDVDATVQLMVALVEPGGRVLELGVGTGRLAFPLADAGFAVTGIDSSEAMLAKLRQRQDAAASAVQPLVKTVLGDMVTDVPDGPFDGALVAYNTIFNLLDRETQAACFQAVADRLDAGAAFVVEAFVPDVNADAGSEVGVRSMAVDHVVLSVTRNDPHDQRTSGQFVEISEAGGVRLRPWSIRWATPEQLDDMATAAGLRLENRMAAMTGEPFTDQSEQHVSVYRKASD